MTKLNPYLFFDGNCEEAFNFYKLVFGKDFRMSRYKDVPQTDRQIFKEEDDKIMHVSLPINTETTLMGSDMTGLYKQPVSTNNFALYINTDTKKEADRLFNELSIEGQIKMPMTETFWGSYYGYVTDKFGISWKITFDLNTE
ncbi:MAG: VOC family protein [Bacteroidia bacterium]|nr:VOC family protein [Bacteroidia bacterium]